MRDKTSADANDFSRKINLRQALSLLFIAGLGARAAALPSVAAEAAGGDGFFAVFFTAALFLIPLGATAAALVLKPDGSLYDVLKGVLGKIAAKAVYAVLFALLITHIAAQVVCRRAVTEGLYSSAPWALYGALSFVLCAYVAFKGTVVLGRAAEIFAPVLGVIVICALVFPAGGYRFSRLSPPLGGGAVPLLNAARASAFWFGGDAVFLLFIGNAGLGGRAEKNGGPDGLGGKTSLPRKLALKVGAVYSAAALLVTALTAAFPLSYGALTNRIGFGRGFTAAADFSFGGELGRIGELLSAAWVTAGSLLETVLFFWGADECLRRIFGVKNKYFTLVPLAASLAAAGFFNFPRAADFIAFFSGTGGYITAGVYLAAAVLCPVCAAVYKRKNGEKKNA